MLERSKPARLRWRGDEAKGQVASGRVHRRKGRFPWTLGCRTCHDVCLLGGGDGWHIFLRGTHQPDLHTDTLWRGAIFGRQENYEVVKFPSSFPVTWSISFVAPSAPWPWTPLINGAMIQEQYTQVWMPRWIRHLMKQGIFSNWTYSGRLLHWI